MIGRYYNIEFRNVENVLVRVLIGDDLIQIAEGQNPEMINLEPSGDPLRISTIDTDEMKFTPIKAQQAVISFFSNSNYSLDTFSDGSDTRFFVTIYYDAQIIFYGFLTLDDNSEAFLPPRNVVKLTATDKIGSLKAIPLTDDDGDNPQGKYTIGNIVAMCLKKTGLNLPINVINNLRHGSGQHQFLASFGSDNLFVTSNSNSQFFYPGQKVTVTGTASNNVSFTVQSVTNGIIAVIATDATFVNEVDATATFTDTTSVDHFYSGTYLDVKTFEKEIGECEDCYNVLQKILSYDCFITQYKGEWWICRIDEYERDTFYISRFDPDGDFIDRYADSASLNKNIGYSEVHWLSDENTIVLPKRPIWFSKLTYNFNYPLELICNQEFERGIGDEPTPSNPNETIIYDPECWAFFRNFFDGSTWVDGTPQTGARGELVKRFEYGYEKERYLLIEHEDVSGADDVHYYKSQALDLREKDKIDIRVDFRIDPGTGFTILAPVQVTLVPHDGSAPWYWKLDELSGVNEWVQRATVTTNPFSVIWLWQGADGAASDWQTIGAESKPLPASGMLYIKLASNFNVFIPYHFTNLQITYSPFVNGSYKVYGGKYEKVSRNDSVYLASVEDEVFISDAESKLFKGALLLLNGSDYVLTQKWFDASKNALNSPTDLSTIKPFGTHQIFAVWNQYRLANKIFQFQLTGFGSDIPSIVHKTIITDLSSHTNNRNFLMLTCEKDLFLCSITGTLEQVYNTVEGKKYDDVYEFKYVS